jgi:hypothetical protein
MTPLAAYNDAMSRARLLLRLHDGLVNRRQRSIRSDWEKKFTTLMHWPSTKPIERVDSRDAIVVLRNGSSLLPNDFTKDAMDELLRAALAMGVGALDRYIHERVTKKIVAALRKAKLTREQRDFAVPIVVAMRVAQTVGSARKSRKLVRPANAIRKAVQEEIHKRPYQSWRDIETALALIGISGVAGKLQTLYRAPSFDPYKKQLNEIVRRRNAIVHEGDLQVHERGGHVRRNAIDHAHVLASLDFIEDLVTKLEQV